MSHTFNPGDVAIVQTEVCPPERRILVKDGELDVPFGERGDAWWGPNGYVEASRVTDARPIAVIDPEDEEACDQLAALLWPHYADNERARFRKAEIVHDALVALSAPKCGAALIIRGEHFPCNRIPGHDQPHTSRDAEAVWGESA